MWQPAASEPQVAQGSAAPAGLILYRAQAEVLCEKNTLHSHQQQVPSQGLYSEICPPPCG